MELAREFLAHAPSGLETPVEWLEAALEAELKAARAAFAELPLDAIEFVRYLASRVPEAVPLSESLSRVRSADLYLAFGCVLGCEAALHRLDSDYLSRVRLHGVTADGREEVLQQLRARLLVAEPGKRSKLAQYRGDGPLLAWLQLTSSRIALEIARKRPKAELLRRAFSDRDLVIDPELDFLKLRYAEHFQRALDRALSELLSGDAALLKLFYLNQTPLPALAGMYGVSTRTVQRRLADVRERILQLTRDYLQQELSLEPSELDSLLALVQSRLHLSLRRLGAGGEPTTPRANGG